MNAFKEAGVQILKIKNMNDMEKILNEISLNIPQNELASDPRFQYVGVLSHKDQTVGNCSWASAKMMLRAALYAQLLKKDPSQPTDKISKEIESKTRDFYKAFTQADREISLEQFRADIDVYEEEQGIEKKEIQRQPISKPKWGIDPDWGMPKWTTFVDNNPKESHEVAEQIYLNAQENLKRFSKNFEG